MRQAARRRREAAHGAYRVIFDQGAATILAVYVGRRATTTYKRN